MDNRGYITEKNHLYFFQYLHNYFGGHAILDNKSRVLEELNQKIGEGKVDEEIIELLELINSADNYYTTSSCAGRIQLISLPKLGDKLMSVVVGKWHHPIDFAELKDALGRWDRKHMLFFMVQSPVIHVVCRDIDSASRMRNLADSSGLKYSTIRSIHTSETDHGTEMNIIVEILSTERMDMPIGREGKIYTSDEHLEFLLELSKISLERSRNKLERLKNNLKNNL